VTRIPLRKGVWLRRRSGPRPAWARWLGRLSVALIALVALGAALPALIPERWLATNVANALSRQLGRPARVTSVRVGWADGVVVEGVEVERREPFGSGLLLRVGRLRCPLAPWRWLAGNLGALQLDEPEVWVVLDKQGRLNVVDLPPPADSMQADSWALVAGVLHLVDQQRQRQTDVHFGALRCELDRRTGRVSWQVNGQLVEHIVSGPVETAAGRLLSEGEVTAPRLNRQARLGGAGRFEWIGLDLGTVPVHWAGGLALDRLAGRSNGRIDLELESDLSLTWRLAVEARDVRAWPTGGQQPQGVESLSLQTHGSLNPSAEVLRIEQVRCKMPGLEVSGSGPAVVVAPRSHKPVQLNLSGEVSDLSRIANLLPELGREGGLSELGGACRFETRWARSGDTDELAGLIQSERLRLAYEGVADCREGCPAELAVAARYTSSTRWLAVDELRVRFGPVEASASGDLPLPEPGSDIEPWLRRFAQNATLSAEISTTDLTRAARVWPGFAQWLGATELSGRAGFRASLSRATGATARFECVLDADSACKLGDVLDKRPGSALKLAAWADLTGLSERGVDGFSAEIRYGGGRAELKSVEGLLYAVQSAGSEALRTDASVRARLEVDGLEELVACVPLARRWLAQQSAGAELTGGFSAVIGANVRGVLLEDHAEPQLCRVRARVAADAAGVQLDEPVALRKPAGRPMLLDVDYLYDQTSPGFVHQYGLRWQTEGMEGQLGVGLGSDKEGSQVRVHVTDVTAAAAHVPVLADFCARYELAGGFDAFGTWRQDPSGQRMWLELDVGPLNGLVPGESALRKPIGVPARLTMRLAAVGPWSGRDPQEWRVDELTMQLAGCQVRVDSGQIVTDLVGHAAEASEPTGRSAWTGPVRQAELAGAVEVTFGQELRRLNPDLEVWLDRYGLTGHADARVGLSVTPSRVAVSGELDATEVQVDAEPYLTKPAGRALRAGFQITGASQTAAAHADAPGLSVDRAWIEADGNRIEGRGRIALGRDAPSGGIAVKRADATLTVDTPRLERVAAMSGVLTDAELTGGVDGRIALAVRDGSIRLGESQVILSGLALRLAEMPFELSSERVDFSHDRVATDGLAVSAGSSSLVVAGEVTDLSGAPHGEWMLAAEWLDVDELIGFVSDLSARRSQGASEQDEAATDSREMPEWVRQGRLTGQVHVRQGRLTDSKSEALLLFDELTSDVMLEDGQLRAPFVSVLAGGAVSGELVSDLREADPYYDFSYAASGVQSREELAPLIESFFPGMKVRGSIAIEERTHARWSGARAGDYPTGPGSMAIEGGTIAGRAAPAAVARIFPGLNLVEFDFRRMRNWFDKLSDGRTHNRMIFIGNVYNIYVDGYTFPDDRIQYQVGIDLLARWENPYWAERAQGRIAMFHKTGVAGPGGTLKDERVRYLAPHEIMGRILRDNLVTTAYYALTKQLRRGN